jgi:hypothetical protein
VTVTVAFGIAAPVASVNVPTTDPYSTWAEAVVAAMPVMATLRATTSIARGTLFASFTVHLPLRT